MLAAYLAVALGGIVFVGVSFLQLNAIGIELQELYFLMVYPHSSIKM